MNIELRHLRYFVAVAEELHFGRAAARLNISQPPLSQQIQALEQQIGARLLARTNRSVLLTAAGKQFLVDSRQILSMVDDAAARAERLHQGEAGELRIGFTSSAPFIRAVSDTLSLFRRDYPDVHLQTREMNTREQIAPLIEGTLDMGLLRNTALPETLEHAVIVHEPLMAMIPHDHPLANNPSVTLAELAKEPFVFFDPHVGTGLYDDILGLMRRYNLTPVITQEVGEAMTIIGLVSAGLGVSILPASFKRVQLNEMRWVPIAEEDAVSEMWLVWPKHHEQSPAARNSRIDLSRLAQLAPASITKIVREMLEAHLVQELEIKEAGNRGRPAVGLVVETEAWHYLSLRISRGEIFLALRDLSSKLVVEEAQELALKDDSPLLDRIISHIDQFFIRHQKKLERLTSIAITLPGIIDTENGIVHRMPFYEDVKEMPLGEALEQHTGVPVYIQHDISAWTMAEALFGASRGARDVIQVVIDHNVGAGVITDGHLLHAGSSSLVEIGHTQVDPYGKRCYCGNHGCLETIASVDSILELAQLRLNQSMSSMLHGQPLTVDSLCQAALRGDLLAKDIITGVGAHVGRILAIMVNLFNPQKILIGSPLSKAADILFPVISDSIRQQALPAYSQHISVESTQFSNQGTMAGAALVKDAMYNGSLLIRLLQG